MPGVTVDGYRPPCALCRSVNVLLVFNRKRIHSRETLGQVLQEVGDPILICPNGDTGIIKVYVLDNI